MVCLLVWKSLAISLIEVPLMMASRTFFCCSSVKEGLRPKGVPSARALANPARVLSINRSRSNSATAVSTLIVILPVALVRSTFPKARQ